MEVVIVETTAEENARLKEEIAAAKVALAAAKAEQAVRLENARLADEMGRLRDELVAVDGDPRIRRLMEARFSEVDARAFLPILALTPATIASIDHLGQLAIHTGHSLSETLRILQYSIGSTK